MTGGQVALVGIVVLLVAVFLALLAGRMGGSDGGAGGSSTPTAPAGTDGATTDGGDEPVTFAMPSGNIVCQITPDATDCLIGEFSYDPVDVGACDEERAGAHLRVTAEGASMPCEPLVIAGDVTELPYGRTQSAHGFACESSEEGITCRHEASGDGFFLARASYELF